MPVCTIQQQAAGHDSSNFCNSLYILVTRLFTFVLKTTGLLTILLLQTQVNKFLSLSNGSLNARSRYFSTSKSYSLHYSKHLRANILLFPMFFYITVHPQPCLAPTECANCHPSGTVLTHQHTYKYTGCHPLH